MKVWKTFSIWTWMNDVFIALYCASLYTQSALQSYGGGGVSPQPPSVVVIRGGTEHVFISNRRGTDLLVRCMRPYDENRQFTPNPEGGARSNATLFDNRQRQQKNSECRELQQVNLFRHQLSSRRRISYIITKCYVIGLGIHQWV